jgi:hypothetical protein
MAKGQTAQWPKDRQHNGQRTDNTTAKGQTTQWPKDRQHNGQRTGNTMAKGQTTQRAKGQTAQWPKDRQHNVLSFLLAIVLSVLWPLCCLSFDHCVVCSLAIVFSVLSSYPFSIFKPFFIYLPPAFMANCVFYSA